MHSTPTRSVSGRLGFASLAMAAAFLVTAPAQAQTTSRPLTDFLNAQQTFGVCNPFILWTDPTTSRSMVIDYSGKIGSCILAHGGPDLGTTVSGTMTQRVLKDGTAEISVLLHLQNAFVYATQKGTLVFGHTPAQVVGGKDAALATVNFNLKFTISAPGAPIPDLSTIVFTQKAETFQQLNAIAEGTFRAAFGVADGTPGMAQTTQTGTLQSNGSGGPRGDFFPAEHIDFHVNGQ